MPIPPLAPGSKAFCTRCGALQPCVCVVVDFQLAKQRLESYLRGHQRTLHGLASEVRRLHALAQERTEQFETRALELATESAIMREALEEIRDGCRGDMRPTVDGSVSASTMYANLCAHFLIIDELTRDVAGAALDQVASSPVGAELRALIERALAGRNQEESGS